MFPARASFATRPLRLGVDMIDNQAAQTAKHALDSALGVGAVTSPFWLTLLQTGAAIITVIGGLILLGLRIMIAWHEWKTRDLKVRE